VPDDVSGLFAKARQIAAAMLTDEELREKCHSCPHEYGAHNSMGDCCAADGRTTTGSCNCPGA